MELHRLKARWKPSSLAIIFIFLIPCLAASESTASDCVNQSPAAALEEADLVFQGVMVAREPLDEASSRVSFLVERSWKGPIELELPVVVRGGDSGGDSRAVELAEETDYLVSAIMEDGVYCTDKCGVFLYSDAIEVELGPPRWVRSIFRRGDVNGDGGRDLSDVIFLLIHLLNGGPAPGCAKSADANSDSEINVTDAVHMLGAFFFGTKAIAPPYPYCGTSTVADGLTCEEFPICESGRRESRGIWMSHEEILALPDSGTAWDNLKEAADSLLPPPNLSDLSSPTDVVTLAKALVFARTGEERYREEVIRLCMRAIDTELDGSSLGLSRGLVAYVVAADLVGLEAHEDALFSAWLRRTLTRELMGRTLRSTHEDRPNNWGTHAGASRAAVALYLDDEQELERTALVFRGFLGDRSAYADFEYGALSWQADPENPVGINPKGAVKDGFNIDGAIPDDMRRGGDFVVPPQRTQYAWESMQGIVVQAEILHRAGFDAWSWEDQAVLRAVEFLFRLGWQASGDDRWQLFLVNLRYGTSFPTEYGVRAGKNMGWSDWTHAEGKAPE